MEFEKWKKSALMACFLGAPYTPSFDAIAGKVFVSPVVRTFIYERTVDETSEWVKRIAQWRFNKIIPAHLDAPIAAGPAEFLAAFEFLERPTANPLPSGDMRPLNAISKLLTLTGLVPPRGFSQSIVSPSPSGSRPPSLSPRLVLKPSVLVSVPARGAHAIGSVPVIPVSAFASFLTRSPRHLPLPSQRLPLLFCGFLFKPPSICGQRFLQPDVGSLFPCCSFISRRPTYITIAGAPVALCRPLRR